MNLRDCMADANRIIDVVMKTYRKPVVMWSSGKDSQVLLFMLRARRIRMPVIFHREPFFPHKYEFADRIIREWDLNVYDYPPRATTMQKLGGICEPVSHYQIGQGKYISLPKNLYDPAEGEPFLCVLQDVLGRPKGSFDYPWDCVLLGHKSTDRDPLMGDVPLAVDIHPIKGGPSLAFPMRQWTDEHVFEYSRFYQVPQQADRYNVETGTENPNKRNNPDHWSACWKCLDRDGPAHVYCPKLKVEVGNMSAHVTYGEPVRPDYLAKKD